MYVRQETITRRFDSTPPVTSRRPSQAGQRTRLHETLADLLGRLTSMTMSVLGLFVSAVVVFPAFKPGDLVAGLGITSIAVGFAFKEILQNFLAGLLLLWRQPFNINDQVRTGD